jgi:hypothetical protein
MTERELEERLRAWYRAQIDSADRAPATLRASLTASVEAHPRSGLFGGRSLALLAAAALLAVLMIGSVAAVGSGFIRLATLVPPGPTPVLPGPTAVPNAAGVWTHVPYEPSMKASISPVVWTGSRFVAVSGGEGILNFITSADGQTWQEESPALSALLTHPGDVFLRSLAAGRGGVAAVGLTVTKIGAPNTNAGMAWFSTDGTNWTAVADPSFRPTNPADSIVITAVTPAGEGWVAVGEEDAPCQSEGCGLEITRAVVWTSSDGLHWTRAPAVAAFETSVMFGVARGDLGYVAVGAAVDETKPATAPAATRSAVWTSTDGRSWSRVPDAGLPHSSGDGSIEAVAAGAGGFVGIGQNLADIGSSGVAWWSSDGRTWKRAAGDFSGAFLSSLAVTPTGYLVIGSPAAVTFPGLTPTPSPAPAPACPSSIWSSSDGRAFTCVEGPPPDDSLKPLSIAASSSLEVLVGEDTSGGAVWVRTLP